ncbi:hypothetical protein B0J13DRAFT_574623 [Dactylonectria estremocensis]|uniref:Zn(2)-C6 fungal-type domain-containing protein n=1 Tax=Dactylonectria estremocensis TaxID=1079267 RepID=A0A9P9D6Y1_9HYPO|nr:hypothetical protein B0J13DRAFT_574623 [Dactylonectria estremocensis]
MDAEEDKSSQIPSGFNQSSAGSTPRVASASNPPATSLQGSSKPSSGPSSKGPHLSDEAASSELSKRSRGAGVITPTACTECRRKRAKCDGKKPCTRCEAHKGAECVYEVPVRQSKENLRTEIKDLRRHARSSEQIFAALTRPDLREDILLSIRSGQSIEAISEWLDGAPTSGGAALPTFAQHAEASIPVRSDIAPLLGMEATGLENVALEGIGLSTMGPGAAQQLSPGNKLGQNSPRQFPSHNQAVPIRSSDFHLDAETWKANMHVPTQNHLSSRPESLQSAKIKRDMPGLKEPEIDSL